MKFPYKHSATGTTIFSIMSALSAEYNAINLSQGFPDFEIDEKLTQFIDDAVRGNHNQYAPMMGLPILRDAVTADLKKRYDIVIDPVKEITITPGATYGIYTAFTSFFAKGR